MESKRILLAEDDPNDAELTLRSLDGSRLSDQVMVVRDGVEALDYLFRRAQFEARPAVNPILVLLDLKMPRVNGFEVLREIKEDSALKDVPVVVLTSSGQRQDVRNAYRLGANAYVVKPVEYDRFAETMELVVRFWATVNQPPPQGD